MDTQLLWIFQREVERQCKFALIAFQDLNNALPTADLADSASSSGHISGMQAHVSPLNAFGGEGAERGQVLRQTAGSGHPRQSISAFDLE